MKNLFKKILYLIIIIFTISGFASKTVNASTLKTTNKNLNSKVSINNPNVIESELLTYDELINEVIKNENLSLEEAQKFIGINPYFRNGQYYRTYSYTVNVTSTYKPTVVFYCKTSEWNNYRGIISVLNTSLNRSYNGISKQFSGTLYTNLENAYTIYFELNGDFYNNGTTSYSGGVEIGVGENSKISFSVSYSSNHYSYCYKTGRFSLY